MDKENKLKEVVYNLHMTRKKIDYDMLKDISNKIDSCFKNIELKLDSDLNIDQLDSINNSITNLHSILYELDRNYLYLLHLQ